MKHIRRRYAALLAGLIGTLSVFGAAAPAFATIPADGGPAGPASAPSVARTVVVGGMPGWQIALIAIGSALIAAALAVVVDRLRQRHLAVLPA
jgi:hypothetical protein